MFSLIFVYAIFSDKCGWMCLCVVISPSEYTRNLVNKLNWLRKTVSNMLIYRSKIMFIHFEVPFNLIKLFQGSNFGDASGKISEEDCQHEYIVNEEVGILCSICGVVFTEIRDVSPPFVSPFLNSLVQAFFLTFVKQFLLRVLDT